MNTNTQIQTTKIPTRDAAGLSERITLSDTSHSVEILLVIVLLLILVVDNITLLIEKITTLVGKLRKMIRAFK